MKSKAEKIEEALEWARRHPLQEDVEKSSALKTLACRVVRAEAELTARKTAQGEHP